LATISQGEIDVILKVASIIPIVSYLRIEDKGNWIKGCIMSNLITRELIVKPGRIQNRASEVSRMWGRVHSSISQQGAHIHVW
jgi:hypothetical protein